MLSLDLALVTFNPLTPTVVMVGPYSYKESYARPG